MATPLKEQDQSWYQTDPNAPNQYRVIPGAGFYMQDQAKAENAYQQATAQLGAQRAKQQISSGLQKDWSVDPHAQYGTYHQMLQGQGQALDLSHESAQQRGFFGSGLGNQGESALRYGQAVEALGFKNQLADWENTYQQGMAQAKAAQGEANLGSLQNAYENAYGNEDFTTYNPYTDSSGASGQHPYSSLLNMARPRPGPIQYGTPTKPKKPSTVRRPPEGAPARGGGRR